MAILERVNYPADLKELTIPQLQELAGEIRQQIIKVVSANGGHLSSNLGTVELTLALHYVFDAPRDKILWDIGHQAYTHKILTGRKERIFTIRKKDGLLGFPDRSESEYDVINTGHASTALPISAGMAIAQKKLNRKEYVVCVIGDGSLTGGVALEALNHIGQTKPPLIIILNDNKMSISPNVGAIALHLNYLASGRPYIVLKETVQKILRSIPLAGNQLFDLAKKIEILMRSMMAPGSLFDELGIKYIGPVNGHNLEQLIKELQNARHYDFPILLHVVTKKGYGYDPAQTDPSTFHSSAPFDIRDGKFVGNDGISYSEIFGRTVLKLAENDEKIVALTAAMPEGTALHHFAEKFPDRFFDIGIAEQYLFDFACGLSLSGLKPVLAVYSTFMQRAVDQIIHDVSLMNLAMVVGIDRAGLVGGDGPTHQGIFDISLLSNVANIILAAPADGIQLQNLIYTAYKLQKPFFIRYPKEPALNGELRAEFRELPPGKAEVVSDGEKGVVFVAGTLLASAQEALETISDRLGYRPALVNLIYLKPLDRSLIMELSKKAEWVATLEDGLIDGGAGSQIVNILVESGILIPVLKMGISEAIIPLASRRELLERYSLTPAGIAGQILQFVSGIGSDS